MAETATRRIKIVTGADPFGCALKDALVAHLHSLNIPVQDLGTDDYFTVGEKIGRLISTTAATPSDDFETRGLVACGTGAGVAIFANKFPGVYAATCLTPDDAVNARSINNCNVLAVAGMSTDAAALSTAVETLDKFLTTPFKSPCPASQSEPWAPEIETFLQNSLQEISKIGSVTLTPTPPNSCTICDLAGNRDFSPIEMIPGGVMKVIRETPTSAVVRFSGGSVEPAHHHSHGHDVVVIKGRKRVWNLSKGESFELGVGDFLYTPKGDVHRVKYLEDTEFFIKWDGGWDLHFDEDLEAAQASLEKEG